MSTPSPGTTTLLFQAPPAPRDDNADRTLDRPDPRGPAGREGRRATAPAGPRELRMLKGARQAATGMKISDAQIRAVVEDPQDVQPDPSKPGRTRLRRDGLVVTTGRDGMILRVARRR